MFLETTEGQFVFSSTYRQFSQLCFKGLGFLGRDQDHGDMITQTPQLWLNQALNGSVRAQDMTQKTAVAETQ